jgi:HSP20 family molecular chaperone IbpA
MFTFSTTTPLASVLNDYSKYLDTLEHIQSPSAKTDITEKFNFAGYDPAGISVTTKDRVVTVSLTSEGKLVHRDGFRVPAGYDVDNMKADYKFGLLTVTIPRNTTTTTKDTRSVPVNLA